MSCAAATALADAANPAGLSEQGGRLAHGPAVTGLGLRNVVESGMSVEAPASGRAASDGASCAPAPVGTALPGLVRRACRCHRAWWAEHLAPVRDRISAHGVLRAAPASLGLAVASLAATAMVRLPTPLQRVAAGVFTYRGHDFYTPAGLYRLPLSGLLAQSWPQWAWTVLVAALLFAPLEARTGAWPLLGCVAASQVVSTAAIALFAPVSGHTADLAKADYGTSCLVVGAAAGYAWLRRSRLLGVVLAVALPVDVVLNAPATTIEHWLAAGTGALVVAALAPHSRSAKAHALHPRTRIAPPPPRPPGQPRLAQSLVSANGSWWIR